MAGTGTGAKKYVVKLSMEERERLEAVISSGKRSAQLITKARILLKADTSDAGEGWTGPRNRGCVGYQREHRR